MQTVLRNLWDNIKPICSQIIVIPEEEEKETDKILKEIIVKKKKNPYHGKGNNHLNLGSAEGVFLPKITC